MSKPNKKLSVVARRERATTRTAKAEVRTPQEQLARLDRAFGVGKGAVKERKKLAARIEALKK